MSTKISDTGDNLLVTGSDEGQVSAAVQKLVFRGAQVLGFPQQIGSNWTASCTKPANFFSEPAPLDIGKPYIPNQDVFDAVTLSETDKHIVVSGKSRQAVQSALDELRKLGGRNASSITQIGNKWFATCEDRPGDDEECTVDAFGFQTMVTGPSKLAVERKIRDLTEISGKVMREIEQASSGQWIAIIDNSGPKTW